MRFPYDYWKDLHVRWGSNAFLIYVPQEGVKGVPRRRPTDSSLHASVPPLVCSWRSGLAGLLLMHVSVSHSRVSYNNCDFC